MFGFGNKKFLSEISPIISDLGNIPLEEAESFVQGHENWILRSKNRSKGEPFTAVMDLASQAMERIDAIHQTEMFEELESIPEFFFLIAFKVAYMTKDVPGNSQINNYFVAIQNYPVSQDKPNYTYKDLIQNLIDNDNS